MVGGGGDVVLSAGCDCEKIGRPDDEPIDRPFWARDCLDPVTQSFTLGCDGGAAWGLDRFPFPPLFLHLHFFSICISCGYLPLDLTQLRISNEIAWHNDLVEFLDRFVEAASMPALEQITQTNVLAYKTIRLWALRESPRAFGSTYARESQFSDADWIQRVANLNTERSVGYLAVEDGRYCGIAGGFLDVQDPLRAELVSMWVAPTVRRSGVGGALIDAVRSWSKLRGAHTLQLMVTSENHSAIQFYERNGFSMTGHTEPYPNDPALFEYEMSLRLFISA